MTILVMPALAAPLIQPHLPDWVSPRFFRHTAELLEMAPEAEIGWFDLDDKGKMVEAITSAINLKWLSSIYAGVDGFPLELMAQRGVVFTNGVGINAVTIAEYVVMGMLNVAKGYREVVRAQDRHEWLGDSPGKVELAGSKALVLGHGAIGQRVDRILSAFEVDVTKVRRSPGEGTLLPDQWRARLGEFDWVILAVPATPETDGMIGAGELAAMKDSAVLVNVARGSVIDQDALVAALAEKRIGGAFLDVTSPEPLPADHPLWSEPNAHVTMHLSGRAQTAMFRRSGARFLENLARYGRGEPLAHQVDLARGY
ncbi:D-2-hydroxyacid dehydrogenase [Novosphingobium sp. PASSN1]|uniref:D-2-hydroxyacid dehydrogenase n=1 Tax=Novosphingobium sp. PASSN1 TaxID=2015561 RepID=UPI000BD9726B|nr:D-2-hydroxyacid dehydrogenase [Novosphingobium sp. PASSN1]OYU35643.1 MAG: D-2-hydroxyacid dehydrogenase [Novosphingobium sp. PASSN1]